jgi:dinuclear metal center YbgI/SA1388 family protein
MNGIKFQDRFEEYFPRNLAYNWDNVGLQIGTLNREINIILLSLDLTFEVVEEAIKKDAELILVHHPLIFTPIKAINTDNYQGKIIELLIKNDITVYVAHTNFDISNYGMNVILANMLKLENQTIIDFTTETEGLGRIGELIVPITLEDYIPIVKNVFNLQNIKLIGDKSKIIRKVAISGGSGSSIIQKAKTMGADLYITGDITYHHALDALGMELNILDVGHNIEKYSLNFLKEFLYNKKIDCSIILSDINTNPYQNV